MRTPTESGRLRGGTRLGGTPRASGGSARLIRFATWVLGVEAMLLVALAVSGLGGSTRSDSQAVVDAPPPVPGLFGLRESPAHSALLLVTGLLALGALWLPAWRRQFATGQALGYLLVGGAGLLLAATTPATSPWHLNPADHVLHGLLCLLGLALLLLDRAGRPTWHRPGDPASPTSEPPATVDPG
ncbi:MAG TPA: hypothetical protein VH141_21475 [Pseudonocardia sp.]|jgi:hypothetical protein|nr:hypothetical protein [Pseudonocardia sp.]